MIHIACFVLNLLGCQLECETFGKERNNDRQRDRKKGRINMVRIMMVFRVITVLAIIGLFLVLAAICMANPIKVLRSVSCVPAQIAHYLHRIYHRIIIIN